RAGGQADGEILRLGAPLSDVGRRGPKSARRGHTRGAARRNSGAVIVSEGRTVWLVSRIAADHGRQSLPYAVGGPPKPSCRAGLCLTFTQIGSVDGPGVRLRLK